MSVYRSCIRPSFNCHGFTFSTLSYILIGPSTHNFVRFRPTGNVFLVTKTTQIRSRGRRNNHAKSTLLPRYRAKHEQKLVFFFCVVAPAFITAYQTATYLDYGCTIIFNGTFSIILQVLLIASKILERLRASNLKTDTCLRTLRTDARLPQRTAISLRENVASGSPPRRLRLIPITTRSVASLEMVALIVE